MAQIYTRSLLNDGSAPDGRSYGLYRVLTLTAQTYTESLLSDGSAPDGRSYSLYQVLTRKAQNYMESLLNDGSTPDSRSYRLYRVLSLTANSYNLHRTLILMAKRRCRDNKMNHPGTSSDNCQVTSATVNFAS